MIVYGTRLFGKCDQVAGMFHVATRFFHIDYLPLIPLKTYVVLSTDGKNFRGVAIPMSFYSILIAWGRVVAFCATLGLALMAVVELCENRNNRSALAAKAVSIIIALFAGGIFWFLMRHRMCNRASFNRANQLAQLAGLNPDAIALIQRHYGQAAGRGFDMVPGRSISVAAKAAAPAAPTSVALYPCRVCRQQFSADQAYTEPDGRAICHTCCQTEYPDQT